MYDILAQRKENRVRTDGVSSWEWKVKEGRGQTDHLLADGVGFKPTSRLQMGSISHPQWEQHQHPLSQLPAMILLHVWGYLCWRLCKERQPRELTAPGGTKQNN